MQRPSNSACDSTYRLAQKFLLACGSDLSGAAGRKKPESLISADFPSVEQDVSDFRMQYFAAEAFSKTPWDIPGVNREAAAYEIFFKAEEACKRANARLIEFESRPSLDVLRFRRARSMVAAVLGKFSWDDCLPHFSFGPGASTSLRRREARHENKWENGAHITGNCLPLFLAFSQFVPGWEHDGRRVSVVEGNRVTTVPKNAKTDRVIAIEPDWNMFFQRGIGGAIRYRLRKRLGLLKPDSQLTHQKLARLGSQDGRLATIDLRCASDSLSLALCEALLPADWFAAMLQCRSNQGIARGETVVYEKISSMGNGFTFELETLIFWALSRAVVETGLVSVYGDDIIVPTELAEEVIFLLGQAGFETNPKKTFISGPFRESCGGHYFAGHDVTPPYFRSLLDGPLSYISAANRVSRAASQQFGWVRDSSFKSSHDFLTQGCRWFGPFEAGDSVVHVPMDDPRAKFTWSRRYQQRSVRALVTICEPYLTCESWGGVLASIWQRVTEESWSSKALQGKVRDCKVLVPGWTGPGPWLDFN